MFTNKSSDTHQQEVTLAKKEEWHLATRKCNAHQQELYTNKSSEIVTTFKVWWFISSELHYLNGSDSCTTIW